MRLHRNPTDETIRRLERICQDSPKDLIAYEAMLAAKIRAGVPIEDDPKTPPYDTGKYAILLNARVRTGATTQPRIAMAARLGHSTAMLVSPGLASATLREAFSVISDRREAVSFACDCAERALVVFERLIPGDWRPRLAIEAVQTWIESPSNRTVEAVRSVTDSCHNAAFDTIYLRDYSAANSQMFVHSERALDAIDAARITAVTVFVNRDYIAYAIDAVYHAYDAYDFYGYNTSMMRSWQRERLAKYLLGEAP